MRLQVALDRLELEVAVRIAARTAPVVDWVEVGTSLIKRYGMRSVSDVVGAVGSTPVLADLKTADDAVTEFRLAFDNGASAATVLGATTDSTIDRCSAVADERGAETVVDLLAVSEVRRDALLHRLPQHVVFAAHLGKDAQGHGDSPDTAIGSWARDRRVALAGGVRHADIARLHGYPELRVIVGSAITSDADPGARAAEFARMVKGTS